MDAMIHNKPAEKFRVMVAAGGTGGHIFPAVAVVEALSEILHDNLDVLFMGTEDRMESTLIPKLGYNYQSMPIQGFKGLTSPETFKLPLKIWQSIQVATKAIQTHKPHAVVCTGAYISYPVGVAARRAGVPLFVLESNLNPGKANRRLCAHATSVLLTFKETTALLPERFQRKLNVVGNPVRSQITKSVDRTQAAAKWNLNPANRILLVFGGSLGARSINNAIQEGLQTFVDHGYSVLWQTGKGYVPTVPIPRGVTVVEFIDDMGAAYAAADLVVCRSGATSIAELGVLGKPAILVPLPTASTDEQRNNAEVVQKHGGAVVINDSDAGTKLVAAALSILADRETRLRMAAAMRALGKPRAAEDAAHIVLQQSTWRDQKHTG